jgi:glycosyltransferase involved in cell wall biosynthesis
METKLVSIIIPCFNQAQYLDEALYSVLNQTYQHWEAIVVNDGSTDNTEEVALNWVKKDNRFRYYFKENGGLSSARNLGLDKAIGDYLQFLDSDDCLSLKKLEIQTEDLKYYQISISDYLPFQDGDNNKVLERYLSPFFSQLEYKKEIIWDWEYRKSFPPHCVLFKRELLDNYNLKFNEVLSNHEDWEFWVKIFYYSKNIFNNSEVLSFYRIRKESMSTDFVSMRKGYLKAAKILVVFFKNKNNSTLSKLTKEKYREIYNKGRVSILSKVNLKIKSKLARLYNYFRKKLSLLQC